MQENWRNFLHLALSDVFTDPRELHQVIRILLCDTPQEVRSGFEQDGLDWMSQAVDRIRKGEPLQYVTGIAHFLGLELEVGPGVLIPRPETEEMTDLAWRRIRHLPQPRILEIGTGSGCIAVALSTKLKQSRLQAWDVSAIALEWARRNAARHHAEIDFILCDALECSSWSPLEHWDLIISNPPYISPEERPFMDKSVREHEPELALYGPSDDPMAFYRIIAEEGIKVISSVGYAICECSEFSARKVQVIFHGAGWSDVQIGFDLQGKERFLIARR